MNKRVKTISAVAHGGATAIEISVTLRSQTGYLTARERETLIEALASDAMRDIAGAPHVNIPLSKIRVRP